MEKFEDINELIECDYGFNENDENYFTNNKDLTNLDYAFTIRFQLNGYECLTLENNVNKFNENII